MKGEYLIGRKEYMKIYGKERHRKNPDRNRRDLFKSRYGITVEEYSKIFEEQEGFCLICKKHQAEFKTRLCVDHCHTTLKVRGLLCRRCNLGLGQYEKNKISYEKYLNDCQ